MAQHRAAVPLSCIICAEGPRASPSVPAGGHAVSGTGLLAYGDIVDGTVRDAAELEAMEPPVYARGLSPNSFSKDGDGEVGATIACGGAAGMMPLDDAGGGTSRRRT